MALILPAPNFLWESKEQEYKLSDTSQNWNHYKFAFPRT